MRTLDLYEILGEARDASEGAIRSAVERLTRQANAVANTAPERSQQLREHARAAKQALLSGAAARAAYDRSLVAAAIPPTAPTAAASRQSLVFLDPMLPQAFAHAVAFIRGGLYRVGEASARTAGEPGRDGNAGSSAGPSERRAASSERDAMPPGA